VKEFVGNWSQFGTDTTGGAYGTQQPSSLPAGL